MILITRLKPLLFGLFVILTTSLYAQKPGQIWPTGEAGKDYNVTDSKGKRQGPWIRVYGSNPKALLYKGQFVNGIPTGVWEWYYPSGELMTKMNHIDGERITENVNYYDDGKTIMSEGRFELKKINGKQVRAREGLWKLYDKAGILRGEEQYADSILNGLCKYYYANGKLVSLHTYKNGIKEGPFTDYYDSGKKEREGTYLLGDFDGPFKQWNTNGTLESEGKFVKGQKHGTWYFYDSLGKLEISVLYEYGVEKKKKYNTGVFKEYHESGIPKSEYTYENGIKDGPFTEWYDIGQFVQVPGSKEDMEMGIMYREKLSGTQIKMQGDYANDLLEGEVIYYSDKGQITKIEVYESGKLISTRQPNE